MTVQDRINKSWNVRKGLIDGILQRGDTLVESLKLIPQMREALTHEEWKKIVADELEEARQLYGNGEPLLSESEMETLAIITNAKRGW